MALNVSSIIKTNESFIKMGSRKGNFCSLLMFFTLNLVISLIVNNSYRRIAEKYDDVSKQSYTEYRFYPMTIFRNNSFSREREMSTTGADNTYCL